MSEGHPQGAPQGWGASATAMLSVASTHRRKKSGAIIASPGEKYGLMLIRINFPGISGVGRRLPAVFFYCVLAGFSAPALADWYQVEVILFNYIKPDADNEWWYENPGLPGRDQSIELIMDTADPVAGEAIDPVDDTDLMPYLALSKDRYRLAGVNRVLELSREYRPLLHVAWQQPGLDSRNIRAIHLDNTQFDEEPAEQAEPQPGEGSVRPEYTPPVKVYDGILRLWKSRFLHVDVDFAYFPESTEQPAQGAAGGTDDNELPSAGYVRLTQSRRIRSEELHYFDHPLFGLVVQVSRIEISEDPDNHRDSANSATPSQ